MKFVIYIFINTTNREKQIEAKFNKMIKKDASYKAGHFKTDPLNLLLSFRKDVISETKLNILTQSCPNFH